MSEIDRPLSADADEPEQVASPRPETIRKRYAATLVAQIFQMLASLIAAGLVPRALGRVVYGNYNFLATTAATLRGFLEPSVQQAFFTFSSQDRRSGPLTKLYGVTVVVQLVLIFSIIIVAAVTGLSGVIWPGQQLDQIILITGLDWVLFGVTTIRQLGDSKGLTVRPQMITLGIAAVNLVALLALLLLGQLTFYTFVILNLLAGCLSAGVLGYWLLSRYHNLCWDGVLRGRVREYVRRWWKYASPLIALEYYTPLVAYLSTYLVQAWYGSAEQGSFALAARWSILVLMFPNAALTIYWREIAYHVAHGNRERATQIYQRFDRLLIFIALALACWLSLSSRTLVHVLTGDEFNAAIPVLMVMAFYPVQQTYGQLTAATMKATERTKLYRNLGVAISIPDLALTYFLLAPRQAAIPGLGLGALGVALKLVVYGLITVQISEWSNFRYFGLNYWRSLLEKLTTFAVIGGCAVLTLIGLAGLLESAQFNVLISFGLTSALYFALIAAFLLTRPQLAGLTRVELRVGVEAARIKSANLLRRFQRRKLT